MSFAFSRTIISSRPCLHQLTMTDTTHTVSHTHGKRRHEDDDDDDEGARSTPENASSASSHSPSDNDNEADIAPGPSMPLDAHREKRVRHGIEVVHAQGAGSSRPFADRRSRSPTPTPSPDMGRGKPLPSRKRRVHARGIGHKGARKLAMKKEREERWREWCEVHRWYREDDPGYKQKVGSKEVQRSDGELSSACSVV